jgi:hypothetical protein
MYQKIRILFFPELLLPGNQISGWKKFQRDAYIGATNPILITLAILSLAHLFLIDLRSGFSPLWLFMTVRIALSALCIISSIVGKHIKGTEWYKAPYLLVFTFSSIGQFLLILYEKIIPLLSGVVVLGLSCTGMGLSVGFTLFAITLLYLACTPIIIQALLMTSGPIVEQLISNFIITALLGCSLRIAIFKDIRAFALGEEHLALTKNESNTAQTEAPSEILSGHLASKVSHDLRSPLAALEAAISHSMESLKNSI